MHKYRHLLVYFMAIQMFLVALGVPVFVRHCQMLDMKKEISFFSRKDNCCENPKKKSKNQNSCKKSKSKPQKNNQIHSCCTFQSEIWQADIKQTANAEVNILPLLLLLFILPNVFGNFLKWIRRFLGFFYQKNLLFGWFNPPLLLKIPIWLKFRNIIR
jgi:hypothetical protein